MSVTSVSGHILVTEFDSAYGWGKCEPGDLFFTAPVQKMVPQVSSGSSGGGSGNLRPDDPAAAGLQSASRLTLAVFECVNPFAVSHLRSLRVNSSLWLATATCSSSGSTAIAKERRSVLPRTHTRATLPSRAVDPAASIRTRTWAVDSRSSLSLSLLCCDCARKATRC